jgi:DNA-binding MarR family transcriptional regulator
MSKYIASLQELASSVKDIAADLKYTVAIQVLYTGLILNRYLDVRARKYGHNRSRLDIMHTLIIHDGILRPTDLSRMTFRSRQTVTQIVDGLERDGLVKRELAGKDRRTKEVVITSKGLGLIRKNLPYTLEVMNQAVPTLSQKQMQEFINILRQIRRHLLNKNLW